MKKLFAILSLGLIIVGCNTTTNEAYTITGNAKGVHNGMRVRLAKIDEKGQQVIKDSAIVMEEKFTIKGTVEEPGIHFLSIDGNRGNVIFMLENSPINIELNKDIPMESEVTGSTSNESYKAFQKGMEKYREEGNTIMSEFRALGKEEATEKRDSIKKALDNLRERQAAYPLSFVQDNSDNYFALNLIGLESNRPNYDVVAYKKAFESFPSELQNSNKGKEVKEILDKKYEDFQKIAHLEVGNMAPKFEAPTPDGKMASLDDMRGKVTIIDFWAAWCGPCRRENPNVVKVYEKYHDKGLEIIGVSLDGKQARQQDPKKAWLEAIAKDKLTWNHVSSLMYFNDPVAKLYNITSIPATYILDSEGKIIAKNLRGPALEQKISELLN
ncbi:MAG: TlpA disulfide reductase family protein [Winogradskyella sp.]